MSDSSRSWFVQAGFGATLGPMPDDALSEMARTGALLPTDLVRNDAESDWQPAADVAGLFAASTVPMLQMETVEQLQLPVPEHHEPAAPIDDDRPRRTKFAKTEAVAKFSDVQPPETVLPDNSDQFVASPSAFSPEPNDLIAAWKAQRQQGSTDLGLASLEEPVKKTSDPTLPMPRVVENLKSRESDAMTDVADAPVAKPRRSLLSQIPPRPQRAESFPEKVERWKRSLPSWPVPIAAVLVLIAVWWLWPRSSYGIYERYLAIWEGIQNYRQSPNDKTGWSEFVERANSELDDTLPWLKANASNDYPDRQYLLWIGKDCLKKMLDSDAAKTRGSPYERQLVGYFEALKLIYDPSLAASETASDNHAADSAKNSSAPEPAGAGGRIVPERLRGDSRSNNPKAGEESAATSGKPDAAPDTGKSSKRKLN